jgi:hypothetical protein
VRDEKRNAQQKIRYERYKQTSPFKHKCLRAKTRAKFLNVPFDLTPEYLESLWTGVCPVLQVTIDLVGERTDEFIGELDRFTPHKGYVKGNVQFLSRRANRLKGNFEIEELEKLLEWMKKNEDHSNGGDVN